MKFARSASRSQSLRDPEHSARTNARAVRPGRGGTLSLTLQDNPCQRLSAVNTTRSLTRVQGTGPNYPKFRNPGPRVQKASRLFYRFSLACESGEFSKAIPHRDELAKCGYEFLFWPRRDTVPRS
jgi:hypothetical protein